MLEEPDELDEQAKALGIDNTDANFESTIDTEADAEPSKEEKKSEEAPKGEETEAPQGDKPTSEQPPAENRNQAFRRIKNVEKQKSKIEEVEERLRGEFSSKLNEILDAVKAAKTVDAKAEAKSELDVYVEKHGVDKTQVSELVDLIGKRFAPKTENKVEVKTEVKPEPSFDPNIAKVSFNNEWNEFAEAKIAEEFPEATFAQVAKAKSKMYELAHSEKFHTQTLGQIFDQSKDVFTNDVFFKPKGKSAESSSRAQNNDRTPTTLDPLADTDVNSVDDAVRELDALDKMIDEAPEYIHRGGEKIKI